MKKSILFLLAILLTGSVLAQQPVDLLDQRAGSMGAGWKGFTDITFMLNALLTLTLAAVLGAIIAYHPKYIETADTLEEIEAPKVFITYSVIGSLIGIMVVKYGLVVGFVLFGIGGLMRFRTVLRSPGLTGTVIFVTLIGLSCGLDLPHVAVLSTIFAYVLIYILGAHLTYRANIRAVPMTVIVEAAAAYRAVFESMGCRILSERNNAAKERIVFIFSTKKRLDTEMIETRVNEMVDESLRGYLDWEVD